MIKVICAGYVDSEGKTHSCGRVIGKLMSSIEGVSHGLCNACSEQAHQELNKMRQNSEYLEHLARIEKLGLDNGSK